MRELRPLFAAYVLSLVGDVVAAVALTVLVFQRTGSPFLAGLTFTLAFCRRCSAGRCSTRSSTASGLRDRVFTVYTAGLMAIQGLDFAAAGALGELVEPHVAIAIAAGCGLITIACLAPRASA